MRDLEPSYNLTARQIGAARRAFKEYEPRDLFYRAATELVGLALRRKTSLSLAEALAVLLQTWNKGFYRFTPFDNQHFSDIERIVRKHRGPLSSFRRRAISTFCDADRSMVQRLFTDFERVLGPVGAAKSLHLLAPRFFPLWDREIARKYSLSLGKRGSNCNRYYRFMTTAQQQCRSLRSARGGNWNPLKAIDEYNYCKYTKRWII
jgi:hypothetical protein